MRNMFKTAQAVVTITGLALVLLMAGYSGGFETAYADSGRYVSTSNHVPVVRISKSAALPVVKSIRVSLNKSTLVELPYELRDVIVSNPAVLDAVAQTSRRVHIIGKNVGQANAFFFDSHGQQVLRLEVSIDRDTAVLTALLARLIPGSRIKVEMLNETAILTGTVPTPIASNRARDIAARFMVGPKYLKRTGRGKNARYYQKVINLLTVEGEDQVMLKVTVAEVQRAVLKQLGVNLGAMINSGNFAVSLLTENALPLTAAAGLGTMPLAAIDTSGGADSLRIFNQGPGTSSVGNSGAAGFWGSGGQTAAYAVRALERVGLLRTLAEPTLTAVSGETAKFLAGGEFPIPVVDTSGGVSVVYKEFGVGLVFTPLVMSEGRLSLKIESEVSEISDIGAVQLSNLSIPALKKRQAKTTVELPSGGSLAIAGLLSNDSRQNIDGFPGLKNIPVLGTLFRSKDYIKNETELVVLVTAYMVRPTSRQKLGRPDDGFAPATEAKASFLGHLNRIYGKGTPLPAGGYKGSYGYIIE